MFKGRHQSTVCYERFPLASHGGDPALRRRFPPPHAKPSSPAPSKPSGTGSASEAVTAGTAGGARGAEQAAAFRLLTLPVVCTFPACASDRLDRLEGGPGSWTCVSVADAGDTRRKPPPGSTTSLAWAGGTAPKSATERSLSASSPSPDLTTTRLFARAGRRQRCCTSAGSWGVGATSPLAAAALKASGMHCKAIGSAGSGCSSNCRRQHCCTSAESWGMGAPSGFVATWEAVRGEGL